MPSNTPRGIHALLDPQPFAVQTFFIGLVSTLAQVVILRELSVAFFGAELIYLLALGVWLLWTAVGALGGSRSAELFVARIRTGFTLAAVVLPLDIVFTRAIRVLFSDVAGVRRVGRPLGKEIFTGLVNHSDRYRAAAKFSSLVGMIWSAGSRKP